MNHHEANYIKEMKVSNSNGVNSNWGGVLWLQTKQSVSNSNGVNSNYTARDIKRHR